MGEDGDSVAEDLKRGAGCLAFAAQGLNLGHSRGAVGPQSDCAENQEERQLQAGCAGCVEDNVGEGSGAVGQEALVNLIAAGYEGGCEDGQAVAAEDASHAGAGVAEGEPESAEADEREDSVAAEMANLANDVVYVAPVGVTGFTSDGLVGAVQWAGGVIGAEGGGGFDGEDAGAEEDGDPCFKGVRPEGIVWPVGMGQ